MNRQQQNQSNIAAEEILRLIYGDDLCGCAISLDTVAEVILKAISRTAEQDAELLELHEKVVEAIDLLSTPPAGHSAEESTSLLSLLSQRLDAIHIITQKLHTTTAMIKGQGDSA
jgi:hypothetical protein